MVWTADRRLPEPIDALLRGEEVTQARLACSCGREHSVGLRRIVHRPGALATLPQLLDGLGAGSVWVVADERTDEAAGRRVRTLLARTNRRVTASVLPAEPPPHPDEPALGRLLLDLPEPGVVLVAVGAGTITDLARFVASRLRVPMVAVPTAASVDGFTSSVAAMIVDGVRVTYSSSPPVAVVADPEVYVRAPARLTASGWAELAGKWTTLADWVLSAGLNDEYLCPVAVGMVEAAAEPIRQAVSTNGQERGAVAWRSPEAVQALMDGLLRVGVAMLMMGNSRPASGSEHHLAHYWEMRDLLEGRQPSLHGERVGVASALVQRIYRTLLATQPSSWPEPAPVDVADHERWVRQGFGRVAATLLEEQRAWADGPWRLFGRGRQDLAARRAQIERRWDRVVASVQPYLLDPERLAAALHDAGAPSSWRAIGLAPELVATSLVAAPEVRPRYTVLHLMRELGMVGPDPGAPGDWVSRWMEAGNR
ncbi:sn-glycerol-1-phosphate dehydrogenase [Geochorda subterranea]|uniref:Sn-glycerol-1-phosphate dehydrogenase n=1 Tax=Geochorda subterranea TaxID=3109564 RepID=A0ABZ1BPL6_9FIRM|nr:sn-glycerol-1-phosphate dehydrogenase [Limnochorda sp. LNt]WRP14341.1 sn-glycerol-1-phosphate dehydrogenase [Limnochorda sp. LNt]